MTIRCDGEARPARPLETGRENRTCLKGKIEQGGSKISPKAPHSSIFKHRILITMPESGGTGADRC